MKLLAFDTSTELLAVGVAVDGRHWVRHEEGGARASQALLPAVHALLAEAGLTFGELDAIAFGRGPGAFTGLRTSCAVAQGLGLALDRPLLPLDSLLVVAEDAWGQLGGRDAQDSQDIEIGVVMDARMDEAYAGRYRRAQGRWQALQGPALMTLPALAAAWQAEGAAPGLVAGNGVAAFGERLGLPAGTRVLAPEFSRAGALLRLAEEALAAGATVDAADALPQYLRDKVALTTAEREAAR